MIDLNINIARERAPCFLILDNLDIILGRSHNHEDVDETEVPMVGTDNNNEDDQSHLHIPSTTSHLKSTSSLPANHTRTRTSHVAIDRLLSTLLVEMDGLKVSLTSPSVVAARNITNTSTKTHSTATKPAVVVIATVTDMNYLDRYE